MRDKHAQRFYLKLVIFVVVSAFLAVMVAAANNRRKRARAHTTSAASQPILNEDVQEPIEAELFTIRPNGFEPTEIRRHAGKFLLAIDNRSGLDDLNLQLLTASRASVHTARVGRRMLDTRVLMNLRPGTYRLTEANHAGWNAQIVITDR